MRFTEPGQRERLVREAKIASTLNHPNIVTIHNIESENGTDLIAMEYVAGKPLTDFIQPGGIPIAEALNYILQIVEGVGKAHAAGITHRDLKPANIIVNEEGLLKILDFGLAKREPVRSATDEVSATQTLTEPGLIMGSVPYMSPEQALGERVDSRSDVFSIGVVLFEMLTGELPFTGKNAIATLRKIQIEPTPSVRRKRSDVPDRLDGILKRALAKEPADRYASVDEFANDLRAVLKHAQGPTRTSSKSRWIGFVAAVCLAAVVAVILSAQLTSLRHTIFPYIGLPSSSAFAWVKQGRAYLDRYDQPGNIERAISSFENAIRQDTNYAPAYAGLAEAYFRKDAATPDPQWKRLATESARKSVQLNSDLAITHVVLGMVLLRTGKPDEAQSQLQHAVQLDPLNANANVWLAEFYADKKDPARAEELYGKAKQLAPDDWNVHQYFGRFLYRNTRYKEAAEEYEQAKQLAQDNILVLRSLATVYHAMGHDDEVWALLQRALEIAPSATAYNNLGTFRFYAGQYDLSAAAFEKAVELNATDYLYWGNLGDAYRWIPGSEENAKQTYLHAIQLAQDKLATQTNDAELRGSLAQYYAKTGNVKEALEQINAIEQLPNRTAGTYFKTLVAYEILHDRTKAIRDLQIALRLGYSLKDISNEPELARLRMDRRYHTAVAQATRELTLKP